MAGRSARPNRMTTLPMPKAEQITVKIMKGKEPLKDQGERAEYIREIVVNYKGPRRKSPEFDGAATVTNFLRDTLIDNSREHFIVLFLDTRNRVIAYSISSLGTKNLCTVHPGEIFQKAVLVGAASIIVAHNHPSGNLIPSEEDRKITRQLREVGSLLQIAVLDHIIVTDEGHYSFCEQGAL